jgi:hypothetical protein
VKGVQAYDAREFHPICKDVQPIDIGGFAFLWCPDCRTLARLEAVAPKLQSHEEAKAHKDKRAAIKATKAGEQHA